MSGPIVGGGKVPIILEGKEYFLEPSLEACLELARSPVGLGGLIDRCKAMHFETICMIIGVGLRPNGKALNPRQRDQMIPKAVYEAGIIDVAGICMEYLTVILNGGRELPDEEDEEKEEEPAEGGPLDSPT